jgi:hypothetical protein
MTHVIGYYKSEDVPGTNINLYHDYWWSSADGDEVCLNVEIGKETAYLTKDETETFVAELMEALNEWDNVALEMKQRYTPVAVDVVDVEVN